MNIREKLVVAVFGYEINLWPTRGQRRFMNILHIKTIFVDLNEKDNDDENQPVEGEAELGELGSSTTGDNNLETVVTKGTGEDDLEEVVTVN